MTQTSKSPTRILWSPRTALRSVLLGALLAAAASLLVVASASADYEAAPEHFQFERNAETRTHGVAVNVSGVGLPSGEAGSFYVGDFNRIVRFSSGSEGQAPQMRESWGGKFHASGGVAINQATGDVYVDTLERSFGTTAIEIFTPTGTPITDFGESTQESIDHSPGKFHEEGETGIAVAEDGTIYVIDRDNVNVPASERHARVMIFEPENPGDYSHYVYAGQSRDITTVWERWFTGVALVGNDRLVTSTQEGIQEYPTSGGSTPICTYLVPGGGVASMTTNSETGEVFFASYKDEAVHRLGPCNEATGTFEEVGSPASSAPPHALYSLGFNPSMAWGPQRGPGVLYATRKDIKSGDIFVPAEGSPPSILSEAAANTTVTSSTLEASIDPQKFGTHYLFQYLSDEAYEANEPDERQALTVSATGGLFGLHFQGRGLGGTATVDLTAGSKIAEALVTARGTATLHAAVGTAKLTALAGTATATEGSATLTEVATATGAGVLSAAEGKGNLTAGSKLIESVSTEKGSFAVGQKITGTGVPSNVTIAAVNSGAGTLELSAKAAASGSAVTLKAGSNKVTAVNTTSGEFVVGQTIAGAHIPAGTKVTAVAPESLTLSSLPTGAGPEALSAGSLPLQEGESITGEGVPSGTFVVAVGPRTLTLSNPVTKSAAQLTFKSSSATLKDVSMSEGSFEVGQEISGAGIPSGTTLKTVAPTELTLSKAVEQAGTAVAISAGFPTLTNVTASENSFEPGTPVSGQGIAAGTTITTVGPESLTLSRAPTKPGTGVAISSAGPAPLAVGESVSGPGIPAETTVVAIESGKLTLSAPAEATTPGAHLRVGLPFAADAAEVQGALEGLATIGAGNVVVSGGPGNAGGTHPYEVEFTGSLANRDLPELETDAVGLSGSATVSTEHDGGGGFDQATEVPVGGGELPGSGIGTASIGIGGLSPETHYRFRAVASSECRGSGQPTCEAVGGPASFSTYPEAGRGLPDGRAYELVSPARKNGGEVFPAYPLIGSCMECKPPGAVSAGQTPMQSASGGSSVAFMGFPFSQDEGATFSAYLAARTASGWETTTMNPNQISYDEDLSEGLVSVPGTASLSPEPPTGYSNLYLQRHAADPENLQPLLTKALFEQHQPNRAPGDLRLKYAGSSPDYSAHYFTANDAFTGETPYAPAAPDPGFAGTDLYEWRGGQLTLVNVLPGNAAVAAGASIASPSPDAHAVSEDGRRVYWKAGTHLYVREDGRTTREIHAPGSFLYASPDGLEVLLSDGCLYSLTTASCTDLTGGKGGFLGLAGASEDLSKIYFVDKAALTPEAEAGTCTPSTAAGSQAGKEEAEGKVPPGLGCNLYSWSEEGGVELIATLLPRDGNEGDESLADWAAAPGVRTAQASPNGRYLAFGSLARLTGYKNIGPCAFQVNSQGGFDLVKTICKEVFLYDSATDRLTCTSCNPTSEAPRGNSTLRRLNGAASHEWLPQPRYLTNAGRLFFDSGDRLSPLDANGRVEDVYEAEPQGTGSCARAAGCVTLISPGTGAVDSNFLAMDLGGANVFFTSRERLVPQDTDELIDLYDARESGGFPAETESQRTECQGESCQPVGQAPNDVTPASSAFHGAGNVKEAGPAKKKPKHKKPKHKKKHKKQNRHAKHDRGGAK